MRAIVLTCKPYLPFAEHMVSAYMDVWPQNPFVFRLPLQQSEAARFERFGARVELKPFPGNLARPPIRDTVLFLLEDLEDDEWVYWCIDDKYPQKFDVNRITTLYRWIRESSPDISGLLFCRCRKLLEEKYLDPRAVSAECSLTLRRRVDYSQIWIHQFLRVSVLRDLFERFPQRDYRAKEMDHFLSFLPLPDDQILCVTDRNLASFGESTSRGQVTKNCFEAMSARKIAVPDGFEVSEKQLTMGDPVRTPGMLRTAKIAARTSLRRLTKKSRPPIRLVQYRSLQAEAKATFALNTSDVFLASYPQSGDTSVRAILSLLLYPEEQLKTLADLNHLVPDVHAQIPDNPDYSHPRVVKTHRPYFLRHERHRTSLYSRVIYVVRSPFDVAPLLHAYLSKQYPTQTWEDTVFELAVGNPVWSSWAMHVQSWLTAESVEDLLIVKYEDLLSDPAGQILNMAEFLDRTIDSEKMDRILQRTQRQELRKLERRRLLKPSSPQVISSNGLDQPPEWTSQLEQLVWESSRSMLEQLGYGLEPLHV